MAGDPLDVLIQAAFLNKMVTPALDDPATPIAYPFVTPAYVPTVGVAHFDAHPIMRAEPEHFGVAFENADFHRGIFQVDAVAPLGAGEVIGLRLAALVAARFPIGTVLSAGSYSVRLDRPPAIATAVKDAPWVRYPVSIPYLVVT